LKGLILADQQKIRDLGLDVREGDIAAWQKYAEDAPGRALEETRQALSGLAFDALKAGVGSLNPVRANALLRMFRKTGMPDDQGAVAAVAWFGVDHPGVIPPAEHVNALLEQIGKVKDAYQLATSDQATRDFEVLKQTVGLFDAPTTYLMDEVKILSNWIYADIVSLQRIDQLTRLTVGQLQLLKEYSLALKRDANDAASVRKELASLPPCDSTKLVKKPSGGHTGTILLVGGVAAAGAVAVAAGEALKNLSSGGQVNGQCTCVGCATLCQPCTCTPNVDCVDNPTCGTAGGASCWYSSLPAPFCGGD